MLIYNTILQFESFLRPTTTIVVAVLILIVLFTAFIRRYKRCPSDRILVVYGKVGGGQSAKCIHGGAAFIFPVIQDYQYLGSNTHFY